MKKIHKLFRKFIDCCFYSETPNLFWILSHAIFSNIKHSMIKVGLKWIYWKVICKSLPLLEVFVEFPLNLHFFFGNFKKADHDVPKYQILKNIAFMDRWLLFLISKYRSKLFSNARFHLPYNTGKRCRNFSFTTKTPFTEYSYNIIKESKFNREKLTKKNSGNYASSVYCFKECIWEFFALGICLQGCSLAFNTMVEEIQTATDFANQNSPIQFSTSSNKAVFFRKIFCKWLSFAMTSKFL